MTVATVSRIREISPSELKSQLDSGECVLVDVRDPSEHASERIPGARLMPLAKFDPASLPANGTRIVLHCKGGSRSAKAAQKLLEAGASEACHLVGGIMAWKRADLPVERDSKAPIDVIRQVQITAGSLVLIGVVLGWFVSPWFFILSAFIGAGLVFAGVTSTCGMAMMLSRMPWNRRSS
jgi:rhodanese-related sulfurtransferase